MSNSSSSNPGAASENVFNKFFARLFGGSLFPFAKQHPLPSAEHILSTFLNITSPGAYPIHHNNERFSSESIPHPETKSTNRTGSSNNNNNNTHNHKYHGLAGAGAGAVAAFVTCPLDVIRTILQVQKKLPGHAVKYSGTFDTFKTILYEEGIRGCYKGLGTTLLALIPNWSIYFYAYNSFKDASIDSGFEDGPKTHLMAATGAAALTDVCVTPLWMIKTRLQASFLDKQISSSAPPQISSTSHYSHMNHNYSPSQKPVINFSHNDTNHATYSPPSHHHYRVEMQTQRMTSSQDNTVKYKSTLHAFKTIVKEEGFFALFKGLTPQIIGIVHVAIQFPLYEYLKKKIATGASKSTSELTPLELIGSSAISKVSASILAYPHEVLRSRFQYQHNNDPTRYKGIMDAVRRIYTEEGYRGFYRGMGANLLRVTPSTAITFTSYELLVRWGTSMEHNRTQKNSGKTSSDM